MLPFRDKLLYSTCRRLDRIPRASDSIHYVPAIASDVIDRSHPVQHLYGLAFDGKLATRGCGQV
jgi:hypothetical protein